MSQGVLDSDPWVDQIVRSIDIIRRGSIQPDDMRQAHMTLESINNDPNLEATLQISYKLITFQHLDQQLGVSVKHFGLQLVENCIKYKWAEISDTTRGEIKATLEKMVCETMVGKDLKLFKEGLSKCVVEAMKREWPRAWPHLMPILLAQKHNDRVLFIFGRLSEELGLFFQPPDRERRRDMTNELKSNYQSILTYIAECLVSGDAELCSAALKTLTPFLEWLPYDEPLLAFLCDLLAMDIDPVRSKEQTYIKIQTTDCLITCLFRKGSKKDRTVLLTLFTPKNMASIFKCIDTTLPRIGENNFFNENFNLAKRLCSVLSMMGQTAILLHPVQQLSLPTWQAYAEKMYSILTLDNYILNAFVLQFWRDLSRSKELQTIMNETLLKNLLTIVPDKLLKKPFGDPSIPMEFDDVADYDAFYYKFRAEMIDMFRSLTSYRGDLCFTFVSNLLMTIHSKTQSNPSDENLKAKWDITAHLLEAVCNRLSNVASYSPVGSPLLSFMIKNEVKFGGLEILSYQLSCISALSIFIPHLLLEDANIVSALLEKIFKLASFDLPGESKQNRSKSVKLLRRHACAFFVKLTRSHSQIFYPIFDQLKAHIRKTFSSNLESSQSEICTLNEGLMLLSNSFEDANMQQYFLNELLEPLNWFRECYLAPEAFISTVGLDLSVDQHDDRKQNRAQLNYATVTLVGIMKRIKRKEIVHASVMAFLNPLCNLLSNLNSLWRPQCMALCHADYRPVVFAPLTEMDRLSLLDAQVSSQDEASESLLSSKTPAHQMQQFLWTLQDSCYMALGTACSLINPEIYAEFNNFNLALVDIEYLPEMKLKTLIRSFLKPFLTNYPSNDLHTLETKFFPFVKQFLPAVFNRIDARCKAIRQRILEYQEKGKDEVESEILEEKMVRVLSMEFVDLLSSLIIQGKGKKPTDCQPDEDDWEMKEINEQNNKPVEQNVSPLADFLINRTPSLITAICFSCLTWSDSLVSWKSGVLSEIVLNKLIQYGMIKNQVDVEFLLENICKALSYFGEYDQNQGICLQLISLIYEKLIFPMSFDQVRNHLIQISDGNMEKWLQFEENWIRKPPKFKNIQKGRREALKGLLDPIIGKSLSIMGKNAVDENRLPPVLRKKKESDPFNDETLNLHQLFIY